MKKTLFALSLGLATVASNVQAADVGPYAGIGAGLHMATKSAFDYESPPGTWAGESDVNFRLGYALSASAGYRWNDFTRTEIEISHRAAGLDNIAAEDAAGRQSALAISANVLFDVGVGTNFYPYIGGGVGLANNKWKSVKTPTSPVYSDSNKAMQWQAIVGVEMPINAQTNWYVDYRFVGSTSNDFNTIPTLARVVGVDLQSHNLMVGARFRFGG